MRSERPRRTTTGGVRVPPCDDGISPLASSDFVKMYWLFKCRLPCQYSYSASDRVFVVKLVAVSTAILLGILWSLRPCQGVINDRRKLNCVCINK